MLPAFKNLGRVQPDRSGITLAIIVTMLIITISFHASKIIIREKYENMVAYKLIIFVASVALFITSFTFTSTLASDVYIAKDYSVAYDAMITMFKQKHLEGGKEEIIVSLPNPGLIPITLDPSGKVDYKNQALSDFYNIGKVTTK